MGGKSSPAPVAAATPAPIPPTIVNTQQQQDDIQTALSKQQGALASIKTGTNGTAQPVVAAATPSAGTAALLG